MKKKNNILYIVIIVSFILFYSPLNALAQLTQELNTTATVSPTPRKENIKNNRMDIREKRKENMQTQQTIRAQRREEFQTRIATIKNEQKKALVERLDQKFTAVNKRQTDWMLERLDKLTDIVAKLQDRITTLKTNGKDTPSAEIALANAQSTIETSRTAVVAQAAKEYTPQVSTESALKLTVGATASQLNTDLATTHQTVITAKQAVHTANKAIVALRKTVINGSTLRSGESTVTPSVMSTPIPIVE